MILKKFINLCALVKHKSDKSTSYNQQPNLSTCLCYFFLIFLSCSNFLRMAQPLHRTGICLACKQAFMRCGSSKVARQMSQRLKRRGDLVRALALASHTVSCLVHQQ